MRKFGIELEMVGPAAARGHALQHAADLINPITPCVTNSYSGRNYRVWQCKSDSSIQPGDRAVEVVSAIMPANPGSYDIVRRVVTRLDGEGYGINRSCGFHCHVNVADLTMTQRMLVVLRYAEKQAEINQCLPPSRRSNSYCSPLSDRTGCERAIDNGSAWRAYTPNWPTRASESVNTAFMGAPGDAARLEFRQAAGTCNAEKVVGWIKFLQEIIDEVVRRSAGVRFGSARPAAPAPMPYTPAPVSRNPLAQVPRMREGSDVHRALQQLCANGVVTTAWAEANGIGAHVLRRMIVGFRRHGAQLTTVRHDNGPHYVLDGIHTLPTTAESIFVGNGQPAAPAPVAAPVAPAEPVLQPTMTAARFVAYPLTDGLTEETTRWLADRRDTFNADRD